MALKPQDILVVLKLALHEKEPWTYGSLAQALRMSPSEVHAAVRRAIHAGLLSPRSQPNRIALLEFLIHGVRYAFAAERGPLTRGIPTAYSAPPLSEHIAGGGGPPPVWPDAEGPVWGEELKPLYKSVTKAVRDDRSLYECLALVDAIRGGRARERELAEKLLLKKLGYS